MNKKLTHEIILASESPRRKELLEKAGFQFAVFPIKVSEKLRKNLNVDDQILAISEEKSEAAVQALSQAKSTPYLLLTADTMVVLNGKALGKPIDKADAEEILSSLSGQKHEVKTAITLYESSSKKRISSITTTEVFFRPISRQEILDYISTGEPMDKAGAYAIQGLGGKFVEKYFGPLDNVIGLPVEEFKKILESFGK
jgi:septum formation protein